MWNLLLPGIEPVSPALAGRFLTTGLPGKFFFMVLIYTPLMANVFGIFSHQYQYQFSCLVVSDSLRPHELQHARPPCSSPTPVYPNSCSLSQWCHPVISSSVVSFSFAPQSFPASGLFQMSQLFASGGQSIGASASASVFPMNIQDWFLLEQTGWISV